MAPITKGAPFPRVNAALTKHELTPTQVQTYVADRLDNLARDLFALAYGRTGVLPLPAGAAPAPGLLQAGTVDDSFKVASFVGLIYNSSIVHTPLADYESPGSVECENAAGTTYHVGARLQQVPIPTALGVAQNGRTGQISYVALQVKIGELGHPDSVVDNGDGTVTITVDTITQAGGALRDHGDRDGTAWLVTPVTATSGAFGVATVEYAAGHYTMTCNALGQAIGSVSTTAADYWVLIDGLTCSTADLSVDDDYLYLGNFAGAGSPGPIGAVDVSGVYRFESTIGTLAANLLQLARDIYTTPTLDGDGVANLAAPLQTTLTSHLNGGAGKHDATEIDDEGVGGFHSAGSAQTTLNNYNDELVRQQYRTPIAQGIFRLGNHLGSATQLVKGYGWDAAAPIVLAGAGVFDIKLAADPAGGYANLTVQLSASGHSSAAYAQATEDVSLRSAVNKTLRVLYHASGAVLDPADDDSDAARIMVSVYDTASVPGAAP